MVGVLRLGEAASHGPAMTPGEGSSAWTEFGETGLAAEDGCYKGDRGAACVDVGFVGAGTDWGFARRGL